MIDGMLVWLYLQNYRDRQRKTLVLWNVSRPLHCLTCLMRSCFSKRGADSALEERSAARGR